MLGDVGDGADRGRLGSPCAKRPAALEQMPLVGKDLALGILDQGLEHLLVLIGTREADVTICVSTRLDSGAHLQAQWKVGRQSREIGF